MKFFFSLLLFHLLLYEKNYQVLIDISVLFSFILHYSLSVIFSSTTTNIAVLNPSGRVVIVGDTPPRITFWLLGIYNVPWFAIIASHCVYCLLVKPLTHFSQSLHSWCRTPFRILYSLSHIMSLLSRFLFCQSVYSLGGRLFFVQYHIPMMSVY